MSLILSLETTTHNCSVALSQHGRLLVSTELAEVSYSHAEKLHPFIKETLQKANLRQDQLQAISVSAGPGSYTGLRIGVSAAKGLCYALDLPLISVDTLESFAHQKQIENGLLVPTLDARRDEVYMAVFDEEHHHIQNTQAMIITASSFEALYKERSLYIFGSGAEKCARILPQHPNLHIDTTLAFPSAKQQALLAFEKYKNQQFEDLAYFEPLYLKEFQTTAVPSKR